MPDTIGVAVICERVVLRLRRGTQAMLSEMNLTEARKIRFLLDQAIILVETGETVSPDLKALIDGLTPHSPPVVPC